MINLEFLKVIWIQSKNSVGGRVEDQVARNLGVRKLRELTKDKVCVIGGTTSGILKFHEKISESVAYRDLTTPLLVVDEASMMVFPHFLALATLVSEDGNIMLAGDHRQLHPIVNHDWEREDRPPIVLYKPFVSAYQAIWDIRGQIDKSSVTEESLAVSQLIHSFRLPYQVVRLIARLYKMDDIELQGKEPPEKQTDWSKINGSIWEKIWKVEEGIFLITHNEGLSKKVTNWN